MSDAELLHEYVSEKSEPAFRLLVERYLPLVYAAALRQVHDAALAQDVAQVVFIILARKAARLSPGTLIPGWLFRTTRHTAAKAIRTEWRRRRREQEALQMQITHPEDVWQQVAPVLDAALAQLNETDRGAVLLHYFQNKRLRDVGLALGITEDAAQKRVTRAVSKLRQILLKRGVVLPAVALPGLLMSHGVLAAPSYLTTEIVAAALSKGTLPASVLTLVQQSIGESIWPKLGLVAARMASVAVLGVFIAYVASLWPKLGRSNASDYTFDSHIAARPHYRLPRERPEPIVHAAVTPPAKNGGVSEKGAPAPIVTTVPQIPQQLLLTNLPPNSPNFAAGGVHILSPAPPDTSRIQQQPVDPGPYYAGAGWPAQYSYPYPYPSYGYPSVWYNWQGPDLRALAYTNLSTWMPAARAPVIVIRSGAPPPPSTRKKSY